jgi:hypothetical protein
MYSINNYSHRIISQNKSGEDSTAGSASNQSASERYLTGTTLYIHPTVLPPPGTIIMTSSASSTPAATPLESIEKKGCLEGTVLSVYDLPYSEQPIAVTLSACGMTVSSGPPLARHKDRNSYRFATNTASSASTDNLATADNNNDTDVIKLVAPLRDLYQSDLKIKVIYNDTKYNLETELPLRQLRVHENKWLILNLTTTTASATKSTSTSTSTPKNNNSAPESNGATTTSLTTTASEENGKEEDMSPPPTIRIKLKLSGPYRPEIAALVNFTQIWFGIVDKVENGAQSTLQKVPKLPNISNKHRNMLLIPIVPAAAILVVASPIVVGVVAMAVPFLLPFAILILGLVVTTLISGGIVYVSTKKGRNKLGLTFGPFLEHWIVSRSGQALVYDTGPRPTPVSVCRQVLPIGVWSKLWTSLLIDLIGSSSYLLPIVGEGFDLGWAPAQTILIMAMYDDTSPNLKYVSFIEEIMPFTDIIPSATIGWGCEFIPILWNDHNSNNNIAPEVTQAFTQLVTTAANVVMTRKTKTK